SRSWRRISRQTAASWFPRGCGPTSGASRCSNPSPRPTLRGSNDMLQQVAPDNRHIIALDLDGTVLDHDFRSSSDPSDGYISEELADAIRTLHEAGHEVIIATGRSVDAT